MFKDWSKEYNQAMLESNEDKRIGDIRKQTERVERIKQRLHVEAEKVRQKQKEQEEFSK